MADIHTDVIKFKLRNRTIIMSIAISIPIFLLSAFIFSTPPGQIENQSSGGLGESLAYGSIRRIDSANESSVTPSIALSTNSVYIVWKNESPGTSDINYRGSENNGQSFKGIRNLSNNTGNSESPQIATAGNNVYVVWKDDSSSNSGNSDIQFRASLARIQISRNKKS